MHHYARSRARGFKITRKPLVRVDVWLGLDAADTPVPPYEVADADYPDDPATDRVRLCSQVHCAALERTGVSFASRPGLA